MPAAPGATEDQIRQLVLAQSPRHVCLAVDDAHLLADGSGLTRLLDSLPANGHLVVAGRRPPAIDVARLEEGKSLSVSGPFIAYLTKGRGAAARQPVADGDLLRGDDMGFEALDDTELIVVHMA